MTQADRETAIANQAFVSLGAARIVSLTGENGPERNANEVYATVRDTLLAKHPWNFAMARASIEEAADDPAFGWERRFALPDDCLRVWRLNDKDEYRVRFQVEQGFLLTDEESPIGLRYIARVADPESWSPAFTSAVIAELAAVLAIGVTNTNVSFDAARRRADDALRDARWMDGQEQGARRWLPGRLRRRHASVSG